MRLLLRSHRSRLQIVRLPLVILLGSTMVLLPCCRRVVDDAPRVMRIAAAASVTAALDAVIDAFRAAHPRIEVSVTYGASGNFHAQLRQQAPFDLFLSADTDHPKALIESGDAEESTFVVYATGRLAICGREAWLREQAIDLEVAGMAALVDPRVRRVAIANPQHAPYGAAAIAAMNHAGVLDDVNSKIVVGENIGQAAHFIQSGAAELGVIAMSLATSPAMTEGGRFWPIPTDHHDPIEQGAVILRWAADRDAAETFLEFMQDPAGRAIMERYGFVVPEVTP